MTHDRRDIRFEDGRQAPSVQMKTAWEGDKLC
jgi:hypothetical protein